MSLKITLFCNAGMSTSLLVNAMRKAAAIQGKDYEIEAFSLTQVQSEGPKADVILIGPQVRHALNRVKACVPESIPVEPIEMRMYGLMDGKGVLAAAEKLLKESGKI